MKKSILLDLLCGALILLFTYTALNKLSNLEAFRFVLSSASGVGHLAGIISTGIPITELVISLLLFFKSTRLTGLYASLVTLSIFTIYIVSLLLFSSKLPCSCGGVLSAMTWSQHIVFNLFFMAAAFMGIRILKHTSHSKLLLQ